MQPIQGACLNVSKLLELAELNTLSHRRLLSSSLHLSSTDLTPVPAVLAGAHPGEGARGPATPGTGRVYEWWDGRDLV